MRRTGRRCDHHHAAGRQDRDGLADGADQQGDDRPREPSRPAGLAEHLAERHHPERETERRHVAAPNHGDPGDHGREQVGDPGSEQRVAHGAQRKRRREARQGHHEADGERLGKDGEHEDHPPHRRHDELREREPVAADRQGEHVLRRGVGVFPAEDVGDDEGEQQHPAHPDDQREHVEERGPRRFQPRKVRLGAQQAELGGAPRLPDDPHHEGDPERSEGERGEGPPGHLAAAQLDELGGQRLREHHSTPPVSRRK
jgi:hypothetical protein